jgi:hypothetical protein
MIPEDFILAGSSDDRETDVVVVDGAVVEVDVVLEVEEHAAMSMVAAARPPNIATFLGRLTSTLFFADITDAS